MARIPHPHPHLDDFAADAFRVVGALREAGGSASAKDLRAALGWSGLRLATALTSALDHRAVYTPAGSHLWCLALDETGEPIPGSPWPAPVRHGDCADQYRDE